MWRWLNRIRPSHAGDRLFLTRFRSCAHISHDAAASRLDLPKAVEPELLESVPEAGPPVVVRRGSCRFLMGLVLESLRVAPLIFQMLLVLREHARDLHVPRLRTWIEAHHVSNCIALAQSGSSLASSLRTTSGPRAVMLSGVDLTGMSFDDAPWRDIGCRQPTWRRPVARRRPSGHRLLVTSGA